MTGAADTRWSALDATRGVAMLFVCLAHFGSGYFASIGTPERQTLTDHIGMVASPTFMLLSGMMLGMLASTRSATHFISVRDKLVDRGLFLLLVAHPLIALAHLSLDMGHFALLRWGFITDAIGVSLIAGPLLVTRLSSRSRLVLAAVLYAASWWLVVIWIPESLTLRVLKDTMVGPMLRSTRLFNFPFLPWFAVYLAGSSLGEALAGRRRASASSATHLLGTLGAGMLLVATIGHFALPHPTPDEWSPTGDIFDRAADLASIFQKLPPGPMYLLAFGGIGLLITAGAILVEERDLAPRSIRAAALLGQSSLFIFILQYYLYFTLLRAAHLPSIAWWPAYYVVSVALVYASARSWMKQGFNRFLTVGYPRWAEHRRARDATPASNTARAHPDTLPEASAAR